MKKFLDIFFDSETSLEVESENFDRENVNIDKVKPYLIKAICLEESTINEYIYNHIELTPASLNCSEKLFEGKDCVYEFIKGIDKVVNHYGESHQYRLGAHNASYDFDHLVPFLTEVYGSKCIDCLKKEDKDNVHATIHISDKTKIKVYDTMTLERMSLDDTIKQFKDEKGLRAKKGSIDYQKYMLFKNNEIVGYGKYEVVDFKKFKDKKGYGRIKKIEELKGINGKDVRNNEITYINDDVRYLPLIYINIQRLKTMILKGYTKETGNNIHKAVKANLYNYRWTAGNVVRACLNASIYNQLTNKSLKYGGEIPKMTKGGKLPDVFKLYFQPDFSIENGGIYDLQDKFFLGGFTSGTTKTEGIAPKGWMGFSVDVNSMYPDIMNKLFPIGELLDKPPIDYPHCKYLGVALKIDEEGNVLWPSGKKEYSDIKLNIIGNSIVNKYQLNVNKFENSYNEATVIWMYEHTYNDICNFCNNAPDIKITLYQRMGYPAREMIETLQKLKKQGSVYKSMPEESQEYIKNQLLYNAAKLLSNNAYGKICEKPKKTSYKGSIDDNKYIEIKEGNEKYESEETQERDTPYSLACGLWVTSMARSKLHRLICSLIDHGHIYLYGDTDSINFGKNPAHNAFKLLDLHPSQLGKGSVDKIFNRFTYPGKAKKYFLYLKNKPKDVEKGINSNGPELLNVIIPEDKNDIKGKEEALAKVISGKFASSGVNKRMISKLSDEDKGKLFSANKNYLIINGHTESLKCEKTFKEYIDKVDKEFNPADRMGKLSDGSPDVNRGCEEHSGVIGQKPNNDVVLIDIEDIKNE